MPRPEGREGIVNEEHVICGNCFCQFSYLYEGKRDVAPDRPHAVLHAPVEEVARARLDRYRKPGECLHPCPNCGYLQPWMVRIGRRLRLRTAASISFGLLCLDYLLYAYLTRFTGMVAAGPHWALALGGLVLVGGSIAAYYALRVWDPNQSVDQESYGGAARVPDPEGAKEWRPQFPVMVVPNPERKRRWLGTLVRWTGMAAVGMGCVVFSLPLVSQGIAYHLERQHAVMLPFWAGILLMASGCAAAVLTGVHRKMQLRRQTGVMGGAVAARRGSGNV